MKTDSNHNVVAVYWDFENIHASLYDLKNGSESYKRNRFATQERLVNIRAVMDYVASVGDVSINRAYSNWNYLGRYREDFNEVGADLIQMFPRGANAKNGADIRLALDVLEDTHRFSYLTHVVIVGGDSDYISLAQKVKQANLTIIGVGVQETTNAFWVKCCNEFKFYKTLLGITGIAPQLIKQQAAVTPKNGAVVKPIANGSKPPLQENQKDSIDTPAIVNLEDAKDLMLRAVRHLIAQSGESKVLKAKLKPIMVRMDSSFDEANYGFPNLSSFLDAFPDVIRHIRDDSGGYVQLLDEQSGQNQSALQSTLPLTSQEFYERVLRRGNVHVLPLPWWRDALQVADRIFIDLPEKRWPSFDAFEQELGKSLREAGLDDNPDAIHKLRGNMYVFRQFLLLNELGIALQVEPGEGRLLKSVEEEMIRRLIRYVPPPLDVHLAARIIFGDDSGARISEIEALIEKVTAFHQDGDESTSA